MMDQEKIGAYIAKCRKEKGLTQAQLAELLGVSDKSVSRWENGRTMPDFSLYEPLCSALEIDVSELLYGKKLNETEKAAHGEKNAVRLFRTKGELETFAILNEILIVVGILISITLTAVLADTTMEKVLTLVSGWFVWGFGLYMRIKIRKVLIALEEQ